ncbi:Cof-type HAD-IIB family hydrolase [Candidatus Mycoplasma mahonii]|uniref:Cof-type HAD-IIB family hydrolase n=1 Tax=Candidatus Mycoplasma mahonii TaxID=3004105 RepID=UPI0026EEFD31|nr:Cof-type HAD-IIB family hydrolase [Candidatus Mycoplasma mahonii]WKX02331.1 Cof-type HAD-IIB family hydrolase [Candidatus Mycoplasma mahonii]
MKNIIFSDIDGTIYQKPHNIIMPATVADIKTAQQSDVEFILCTGNGYFDNISVLAEQLDVRYIITSNGAAIFDRDHDGFIYTSMLPHALTDKLFQFGLKHEISCIFWDKEHVYINHHVPHSAVDIIKRVMTKQGNIKKTHEVKTDIFKIEFYDNPEKIDLICDFAKDLNLQLARMTPNHVEITHKGVSKGHTIVELAKRLNIPLTKTMGIGDSSNDLSMFEVVNSAYAMDNATPEVKAVAKYYTSDVEQNGLGEAIIDYLHREKLDRNL